MNEDLYGLEDNLAYFLPVRPWEWETDETQVGAVPSGTGDIKDEAAGSQFKFGASQDGAGQVWGVRQPLVSCDSPYLSSASPGSSSDAASPFLRERAVSECEGSREQTGERGYAHYGTVSEELGKSTAGSRGPVFRPVQTVPTVQCSATVTAVCGARCV